MPESSLIPDEGEAPPPPPPLETEWRTLAELSTVDQMSVALSHEEARMKQLQREALDRREVRSVVEMLISSLERVEIQAVHAQQHAVQAQQIQQIQARPEHLALAPLP